MAWKNEIVSKKGEKVFLADHVKEQAEKRGIFFRDIVKAFTMGKWKLVEEENKIKAEYNNVVLVMGVDGNNKYFARTVHYSDKYRVRALGLQRKRNIPYNKALQVIRLVDQSKGRIKLDYAIRMIMGKVC